MYRVAILGPDGAGKTTFARALARELLRSGLPYEHVHFVDKSQADTESGRSLSAFSREARSVPLQVASVLVRFFRAVAFSIKLNGSGAMVVIHERSFLDQLVDPSRYRLTSTVSPLVKALGRLLPKYDFAVSLGGDAGKIACRKMELTPVETVRQINCWREVAPLLSNSVWSYDTVKHSTDVLVSSFLEKARIEVLRTALARNRRVVPLPKRIAVGATSRKLFLNSRLYVPQRLLARIAFLICGRANRIPLSDVPEQVIAALAEWNGSFGDLAFYRSYSQAKMTVCSGVKGKPSAYLKIYWESSIRVGYGEAEALEIFINQPPRSFATPPLLERISVGNAFAFSTAAVLGRGVRFNRTRKNNLVSDIRRELENDYEGLEHKDLIDANLLFAEKPYVFDWENTRKTHSSEA